MPLIAWNDTLSVKVTEMDDQHKKLIDIINRLHDAMAKRAGQQVLGGLLNELIDYTVTHFQCEEKYMRATAYPGYTQQKQQHDGFIKQVQDLQTRFQANQPCVTLDAMEFLKNWLTKHIQGTDKQYSDHFTKAGVGQAAGAKA
jgi:hemerythrin